MIRLEGIYRTYMMGEHRLHALRDVTLTIEDGEHIAVMGPSGSGKSTLLNILGCLDRPTAGTYSFEDRDVSELDEDELAELRLYKIGFIFQSFHLIPRLDALANIALPMLFAGVPSAEREARAMEALTSVGLAEWQKHRPGEMSGGQKQRIAIARATVMRPSLLLADEPTGNLDSASGAQVLDLLCALNRQGITLVTVTHDPNVARLADRVIVLVDGAVLRQVRGEDVSTLDALFSAQTREQARASEGEPA